MCVPCKGCTYRHMTCHDECESYITWKNEYNKRKAEERKLKMIQGQLTEYEINKKWSMRKRKRYKATKF